MYAFDGEILTHKNINILMFSFCMRARTCEVKACQSLKFAFIKYKPLVTTLSALKPCAACHCISKQRNEQRRVIQLNNRTENRTGNSYFR